MCAELKCLFASCVQVLLAQSEMEARGNSRSSGMQVFRTQLLLQMHDS
jgi:hypothetical protein